MQSGREHKRPDSELKPNFRGTGEKEDPRKWERQNHQSISHKILRHIYFSISTVSVAARKAN